MAILTLSALIKRIDALRQGLDEAQLDELFVSQIVRRQNHLEMSNAHARNFQDLSPELQTEITDQLGDTLVVALLAFVCLGENPDNVCSKILEYTDKSIKEKEKFKLVLLEE